MAKAGASTREVVLEMFDIYYNYYSSRPICTFSFASRLHSHVQKSRPKEKEPMLISARTVITLLRLTMFAMKRKESNENVLSAF